MTQKPTFQITNQILKLSEDIGRELGILEGAKLLTPSIKLRKDNQINTIHSSLAIEGNSLSLDQVSGIILGKRVLGLKKDIVEVNNAIKLYRDVKKINPLSLNALLDAHRILMQDLIEDNGKFRIKAVGIFKGDKITHLPPAPNQILPLMEQLFNFINPNNDISWLIKACAFHYKLEFIHPFSDGNGRMGRLWQQLLLMKWHKVFEFIVVEGLIKDNQQQYYETLAKCDKAGTSTLFIEFMAELILQSLRSYESKTVSNINTASLRMEYAKEKLKNQWFSRKQYFLIHKDISLATASRDLIVGVQESILTNKGEKNQTYYKFR